MLTITPAPMCDFQNCTSSAKHACLECEKVFYCTVDHLKKDHEYHRKSCEVFKKVASKARLSPSHRSLQSRVTLQRESKHAPKKSLAPLKTQSRKPINNQDPLLSLLIEQVKELNNIEGQGEVIVYHKGQEYRVHFDALRQGFRFGTFYADAHILVFTEPGFSREIVGEIKKCFPEEFSCILATKKVK